MSIESSDVANLISHKVLLKGHFEHPVIIEDARSLGSSFELRVRLPNGHLEEAVLTQEEIEALLGHVNRVKEPSRPVDPEKLRLLVESARIRLAYSHDRQFAVSLSGTVRH